MLTYVKLFMPVIVL